MIITHSLYTTLVVLYYSSTLCTLNAFVYDKYKVARAAIKYVIPTVRQSHQFHKTVNILLDRVNTYTDPTNITENQQINNNSPDSNSVDNFNQYLLENTELFVEIIYICWSPCLTGCLLCVCYEGNCVISVCCCRD